MVIRYPSKDEEKFGCMWPDFRGGGGAKNTNLWMFIIYEIASGADMDIGKNFKTKLWDATTIRSLEDEKYRIEYIFINI